MQTRNERKSGKLKRKPRNEWKYKIESKYERKNVEFLKEKKFANRCIVKGIQIP